MRHPLDMVPICSNQPTSKRLCWNGLTTIISNSPYADWLVMVSVPRVMRNDTFAWRPSPSGGWIITYITELLPIRIRNLAESVQKKGGFPCLQTDTLALEPSTTLHYPC